MDAITENWIEYHLYPLYEADIDNVYYQLLEFFRTAASHYIWNDEVFSLTIIGDHFSGKIVVGDNIEDEWFVVALLMQCTTRFPQLAVSVIDNDGDFLLIEAANVLPKWVNYENMENRVFLFKGFVHLIGNSSYPGNVTPLGSSSPKLSDAFGLLRNYSNLTIASEKIQNCLAERANAQCSTHSCRVKLPRKVAYLLHRCPQLISIACNSFFSALPSVLKNLKKPLKFESDDIIECNIKMTRYLYAKFLSSVHRVDSLGEKITYGFELYVSSHELVNNSHSPEFNKHWQRYLEFLNKSNYFCGELEGSALHSALLKRAKNNFEDIKSSINTSKLQNFAELINECLSEGESCGFFFDNVPLEDPDDDSWLEIDEKLFERTLSDRFCHQNNFAVSSKMNNFMKGTSSDCCVENKGENSVNFDPDSFKHIVSSMLAKLSDDNSDSDSGSSFSGSDEDFSEYVAELEEELSNMKNLKINSEADVLNVDKHLAESYASQLGLSGPISNVLSSVN